MLYVRYTGLGWLTPVLIIIICLVCPFGAVALIGVHNALAGLLIGSGFIVLLSPIHWLLGFALNSEMKPSGRRWHNRHTAFGSPIQYGFVPQLLLALTIGSLALGKLTSPLYGWLLFASVPVVGLTGAIMLDTRKQLRSVADRKELAAERGWFYEDKNSQLGKRWQDLLGKQEAILISPFGVLAGEVEGLPFTVFDRLQSKRPTHWTYWVIHLPVAYPRVQMVKTMTKEDQKNLDALNAAFLAPGGPQANPQVGKILHDFSKKKPPTPDNLGARTRNTAFGKALLTLPVRSATVEFDLIGWYIEDRDLLFIRRG